MVTPLRRDPPNSGSRTARILASAFLLALSCSGEDSGTPTTPSAPRPAPQEVIGLEIFVERTAIRVGQTVPLAAYGHHDDGTTSVLDAAWTSSDSAVVQLGEDLAVTGAGVGAAEVTATFESFTATAGFEVTEPTPRSTRDRPDDFFGPQIHVVYALPSDLEDVNLDRYGDIERSMEAIQNWLSEEIGYRLRLDTYGGKLEVSFVPLPFADGDPQTGPFILALGNAVAAAIGYSPNKLYAIYYAGRAAGSCGSAEVGGAYAAVYVHREGCSDRSPGLDREVASTYEGVMVHELLHSFGAASSCAADEGGGAHVQDDPRDLMYAGAEHEPGTDAVIDVGRDDYFGHGRVDCLDSANSIFWEPVESERRVDRDPQISRIQIPARDWPLLCDVR